MLDRNEDGRIEAAELEAVVRALRLDAISHDEVERMIREADIDGNGAARVTTPSPSDTSPPARRSARPRHCYVTRNWLRLFVSLLSYSSMRTPCALKLAGHITNSVLSNSSTFDIRAGLLHSAVRISLVFCEFLSFVIAWRPTHLIKSN